MSNESAISLRHLSKVYRIWNSPEARLKSSLWGLIGQAKRARSAYRDFEAVSGINLEIFRGQSVGIIGLNGSGKSTLLQMIAGTIQPTAGELKITGRVAALLELGAGFNPDFSGRENVYLNATVLGLSRQEIDARFPAIAAFADIGDFIEQPVKTYSSGMFVRLAFAVLTQIDPEILIIDEALSVGDFLFQQKCFDTIREFKKRRCTFLFVSHGMGTVLELCDRVVVLDRGRMIFEGPPKEAVDLYEANALRTRFGIVKPRPAAPVAAPPAPATEAPAAPGPAPLSTPAAPPDSTSTTAPDSAEPAIITDALSLESVRLLDETGRERQHVTSGQQVQIEIVFRMSRAVTDPHVGFKIRNHMGVVLFETNTYCLRQFAGMVQPDESLVTLFQLKLPVAEGEYSITAAAANGGAGRAEFTEALHFQHSARHFAVTRDWEQPHWSGVINLQASAQVAVKRTT